MKEVLLVLFSSTSSASGAKRAVCSSQKQRKFLSVVLSGTAFPFPILEDIRPDEGLFRCLLHACLTFFTQHNKIIIQTMPKDIKAR